jgi:hypothetical protein
MNEYLRANYGPLTMYIRPHPDSYRITIYDREKKAFVEDTSEADIDRAMNVAIDRAGAHLLGRRCIPDPWEKRVDRMGNS